MRRPTTPAVMAVLLLTAVVVAGLLQAINRPLQPPSPETSHAWTWIDRPEAEAAQQPNTRGLPRVTGTPAGRARAAQGVPPPTNRWYSGMLFGRTALPVFAVPLALQVDPDAVSVCLPTVSATATTVAGGFSPDFRVGLPTDRFEATRAGPVSVSSTFASGTTKMGRLTVAEGWPYVAYTALRAQTLDVPGGLRPREGGLWWSIRTGDQTYGLAVTGRDGQRRQASVSAGRLRLAEADSVLMFAGHDERTASTLAESAVPIDGTAVAYSVDGEETRTRIRYLTAGDRSTIVAAMPHHRVRPDATVRGRVPSIYGPLRLLRDRSLTTDLPTVHPRATLDLGPLTENDRRVLREQVQEDISATVDGPAPPADTYFGGKYLYRLAQLYRIAHSLEASTAAADARRRLVDELDAWLIPSRSCEAGSIRCFGYDTRFKGVVGRVPSFGSEEFNDHHFHYGYFLAAAGLVGEVDPGLLEAWRRTLSALAADIASPVSTGEVPALRNFDPYTGHSWASGTSPFADGNNQESSSEAVNAWNGLAVWAQADGRPRLARQATWQLTAESATARAYWLEPQHLPDGFEHEFTSINWGGKRDWATWFSAEPSAILGIQLIPMPPVFEGSGVTSRRVRSNLSEAAQNGYHVPFGDYMAMYLALVAPARALSIARELPESAIDDGNSRSYLLAWVLTRARQAAR